MRVFYRFVGLVVLTVQCFADYNPLEDPNICGLPTCKVNDDQQKFKYGPGKEQTYKYSVEVKSLFNGTSKNESSLFIEGKATLGFLTPCDGLLYLSDIKLSENRPENGEEIVEHANSMEFADVLTTHSVRFAFQDGIIYEVCPREDETDWALNFKKGILSMLQNSMKRFDLDYSADEEDVRGKCPTEYKVFGVKETTLLIEKTKDLERCQGRSKLHSSIQSQAVPILQGNINKDNILKSKSRCIISIDRNIYKEVTCEESYLLQPFSKYEQGATTTVTQQLILLNEIPAPTDDDVELTKRVPLTFDNVITAKPISDDTEISKESIKQLCELDKMPDRMGLADLFSKFILSLRSLSYSGLTELRSEAGSICPTGKQFLLNALPFVDTVGAINLMKDIIVEKTIPEATIKDYISAIGFTSNPTSEMMDIALDLLQQSNFSLSAMSVASLTHTFCRQNRDCSNFYQVSSIVEFYENHFRELFQRKPINRNTHDEIMVTLKALSNIGVMSEDFVPELFKVIENSEIDAGLRVAVVETFRRTSCHETRSYFEHIFRTQEIDAEVRIAAYLQIMRCPDYLMIKNVRHTLLNEEVNQVGSFVWTHLNNLLTSAKPSKVEVQSLLSDKDLSKKFENDVRKFSRNFEGSMYFDEYNVGGNYESNVIFSTNSYVPKSAMLNLTVDLFGESFNILEIYSRVDGLEHYLESIFGPKGSSQTLKESIMDKLRWDRAASSNALIKKNVDQLPNVVDNFAKEPKVAFGYKIFGNEIKYTTFAGDKEIKDGLRKLDPTYNLAALLSGKEINYNKASMFLDGKYIVPTGAGLPLSLAATGTASINIKLYGSLTPARSSKSSPFDVDLTADIQPTVSVDLTGEMSVDAIYASTGIKLKTNLYSDSAIKADVKISGTNLVSLKFSLPREKNEIFVASSELLVKKEGVEETQKGLPNTIKNNFCSWPVIDQAIGLKLCANYNFVNLTKITNLPYLLMVGPANFRISLHKADPTATVYLFEYKYVSTRDTNVVTVIFDTPGSAVKRLISANLTLDNQSQNVTLLFQSASDTVVAYGRYKFTPEEKLIQVEFDINNFRHFEAGAGIKCTALTHGFSYRPLVYLRVNGENIVSFTGSVDTMSKNGVSQYSVHLQFGTKRFQSLLYGYILIGDTSVQGSLTNDYQFMRTKKQRVSFKFGVKDQSHKKNMDIYTAFLSVLSSAYPNMNLDANATLHGSDNHKDFSFKLYQSPLPKDHPDADDNTLKFEVLATQSLPSDGTRKFKIETSINRRSNNLDLKGEFTYEIYRYDITSVLVVQYGNNKEVSITVFWSHPRSNLEHIKTHINITIPSFTPMILRLEIMEKQPKDYMIDFKGTWFSGHSMNAAVSYQDKSDPLSSNHHVKLLLMSPHFKDITIDLQFYRDNDILKFDLKGDIDRKQNYDYRISLIREIMSQNETKTVGSLKYGPKLYSFSCYINDGNYKTIVTNIHIDQIRDIVFSVKWLNQQNDKAIEFEINWDSNRNANQKVMVSATYKKQAAFDYTANFMVTYPGRGIKGDYKFLIDDKRFKTLVSVSWDVEKTFAIDLDVIYESNKAIYFEIASELKTPFDNWKVTQLKGRFQHLDHMYDLYGIVSWERRQKVHINVFGNYSSNENDFSCTYSCSIVSTVDRVPNVNTTISHLQNETDFNTDVTLMYNPDFVIGLESKWKLDRDNRYTNVTGKVITQTPFKGFKDGALVSKVILRDSNYIRGAAQLDLDQNRVDLDMEGNFIKLTNCMLVINATTSKDNYQLRFIVSSAKRHFVALITYPTGGLGGEVLLSVNTITNFDVKLHLATPLEFLQDIILVAKLKPEEADFRIGWNFLLLGFSGVWHYANVADFDYSYKIYTPIEGFEENGVVGKLIFKEGLDFEFSIKFSYYKLGAKLLGQSKPKPLKELGIKLKNVYMRSKQTQTEEKDYDDPLSWEGLIELDVIIYPTMKGELEIDQRGTSYILKSKLTMPHGTAEIFDQFDYVHTMTIRNNLEIKTPYPSFSTVTSNFDLNIRTGHIYLLGLNFDYQNRTQLIKTGVYAQYIVETRDVVAKIGAQERTYNVTLKVNTPFKALPNLNLFGAFETEENFYHTKLLFNTNRSDISVDATIEIDNGRTDLTSRFHVTTPSIYIPPCELIVIKLFSPADNYIDVNVKMPEKLQTDISSRLSWMIRSTNDFRGMVQLVTPFTGLENTTGGLELYISDLRSSVQLKAQLNPIEVEMYATLSNNVLIVNSHLTFNGDIIPLTVNCSILKPSRDRRDFKGILKLKDKQFRITGNADLMGTLPSGVSVKFTPEDNSPSVTFEYRINLTTLNRYELLGSIRHSNRFTNFNANLTTTDNKNYYQLDLKIFTSNKDTFIVHGVTTLGENKAKIDINAETPITKLEHPKLGAVYTYNGLQRDIEGFFDLTDAKGNAKINFIWLYMENMLLRVIGRFENKQYASQSSLEGFYENPQKSFKQFKAGGDVKFDRLWETGTNITVMLTPGNYKAVEAHIKLPDEHKETYSLWSNVDYKTGFENFDYRVKYRTSYTQKKYGSSGKIFAEDKQNLTGNIEVEWNGEYFNNFANLKRSEKTLDLIYKLKTPKFTDKQLLVGEIAYTSLGDHYNLTCEAFSPEDRSVAYATVDYKELANMNGTLRITLPNKSVKNTGAYFSTKTNAIAYNRYIKVFWDGDNALLDSKCDIKTGPTLLDRNTKGKLIIELPLTTRHIAVVDYDYDEKAKTSLGQATVNYNGGRVLEGKYNRLSESQAGKDKDTVHVEVQNDLMPVGADYIYKHDYGLPHDAFRDYRVVHLYNLKNRSKFNVSGELDVLTKCSGQEYTLTAIHSNRVVKFWTDYDGLDKGYKQHSKLELSPTNWIEYDFNIFNKSSDEKFDAQQVVINVIYPSRSFTAQGFYNISDSIVSTDVSLVYDRDNKTVQAGLDWRRASLHREQLLFQIKHPSFERDVTFSSEYGYDKSSIDGQLLVEYSLNPNQKLSLRGKVNDNSNLLTYNYTYNIWAKHIATNLNLNSRGDFYWSPSAFGTEHVTDYQRSYLPSSVSETLAKVSLENNEVEFKRDNIASGKSYFWGRYDGEYPVYTANMSAIYDTNDTKGGFYINFKKKLLYLNLNMTEDGTQSLHMYGVIPDARSAVFDIWRDYDDRRVSDVAYFLRLNHSRLIMSSLKWRPDLIGDVTSGVREGLKRFYEDTLEAINNTKQYVKSETVDAINGIWIDSKPTLIVFLRDLRNITVIEEDFEELKVFLNNSYYANDFYIKDITDLVVSVFDDLALKSHLQSLPKIVQEIWSVMGDSGLKIKKSILWIIEKVKTYYKNVTEFIHSLLNGDPIESLSIGLEKLVEKYDAFIKSLHVAVIQYMENLWSQMYTLVIEYWHKTLASIEPTFLKFVHYLESIVWNTGQKFIDFLYLRKNEIIESPYFLRFAKFSQDLDKFYKDITGENTIASIYKYTKVAWNFIKEKYLALIPFGKETMDVFNEIIDELKQIGDIPSVKFLIDKWWEAFEYAKYYYEYLDMENRIHRLIRIVYLKLTDLSMTALETENRQRVPKTKFIFEPNDGIMLLEQKLPMSWHAFNETPKFKEIPEIKKVFDIMSYLEETELSFWNLYYDYKPYMDPNDWLPPFKGHAMLVGNKYYVTFDQKFYSFRGQCTYLLATDFVDKNFTLLVSYDESGRNDELIMLVEKTIVRINIFTDKVLVGESSIERLPMQIGETYLYKDAGIFKAESQLGFILECNMKFHTCMFEMSGWYFGKTAGLWGTYNNEPTDDFLTSNKTLAPNSALKIFGDSWSLDKNCKSDIPQRKQKKENSSREILELCEEFFTSRISQLSTCFPRIPKDNFLYMCLNSTTEREACMSAVSYINLCSYANTPLRIPDTCIKCNLLNGSEIQEGHFIRLQGGDVPQTADIVFIVEAKSCNKNLKKSRNFDLLVELMEKELQKNKLTNNSYAIVTFGGDGVFDEPRNLVSDGKIFTNAKSIIKYFDQISIGNGSSDIFNGIMFAYNLIFRPGVSRNFILIPCSECNRNNMQHDYSTIHQLLSESAISLHILMNNQFTMQKGREVKIPFGIDRRFAYTKKDVKGLVGDQPLRKSISLPKSTLGLCMSLSLETNGTIYSAKLLETEKKNVRRVAFVFAKTFARAAAPTHCVDCECTAPNSGVSYMECTLCTMANSTRYNFEMLGVEDDDMHFLDGFNF